MVNGDRTRSSLELLYNISRELTQALDLRVVLQRILSLSLANVGGERGSIVVVDDHNMPVEAAIVVEGRLMEHTTAMLRETLDRGLAGWVVRQRLPALVPDTSLDSRWLRRPDDAQERSGAKSAIVVPLMARVGLVGVLTVVHPQPGFYSQEHLDLIQAIADQAGIAVLNARLYEESQRQARVMTALVENALVLNASLRLEEVLQRILDRAAQALQAEMVFLGLTDESTQELVFQAATGTDARPMIGKRQPLGTGIAGKVIQEGRGVIIPAVMPGTIAILAGIEVRSLVCAPVYAHGKAIGALEAINSPAASLDADALLMLTGIGSLAGVAITNARLFERLDAAHERYRELFESSIDPLLITDRSGKIIEANRQAMQMTGRDSETLTGMNIGSIHTVNNEKVGEGFSKITELNLVTYESQATTVDGQSTPVEAHVYPMLIEGHEFLQWTLRDITERKNLASLQDDLIAMIYHDLRSPLANVVSSLDLLEEMLPENIDESFKSVLGIAERSTDRLQRLINSLLDTYRLDSLQTIANREVISPASLVGDAVETVLPLTESKHQQLEDVIPENLPDISVDPDMIRRVLVNLLENASKYSPLGGKVKLMVIRNDDHLQFMVQDNGLGIPRSDQERIFNKFVRLEGKGIPKGLGLGLAFCRLAIRAHGGKIWVESQPPDGSRFFFTLPLA